MTAYFVAIGLQVVVLLLGGFGPDNLLAVAEPAAANALHASSSLHAGGLVLTGVAVLVARRRRPGFRCAARPACSSTRSRSAW